jgi:alkylation response protein AidB-like acyl-CoA dehydrogenase
MRAAARIGLTRYQSPKEAGGFGFSVSARMAILETLARHCMPFAFCVTTSHTVALRLAREGYAVHRERYLERLFAGELLGGIALIEPQAGSDFAAINMRAEKIGDGWRLDGEKAWVTSGANPGVTVTYAQTDPSKGWRGIACFLVDASRPGYQPRLPYPLAGGHVIGTAGFALSDYRAEAIDLIQPAARRLQIGACIDQRHTHARCRDVLRHAGRCIRRALAYGRQGQTFGTPLLDHQGLRWMLVDAATDLQAARALTARAIDGGTGAILPVPWRRSSPAR